MSCVLFTNLPYLLFPFSINLQTGAQNWPIGHSNLNLRLLPPLLFFIAGSTLEGQKRIEWMALKAANLRPPLGSLAPLFTENCAVMMRHILHTLQSDALQLIVSISTLLVSSLPDEKEEKCC